MLWGGEGGHTFEERWQCANDVRWPFDVHFRSLHTAAAATHTPQTPSIGHRSHEAARVCELPHRPRRPATNKRPQPDDFRQRRRPERGSLLPFTLRHLKATTYSKTLEGAPVERQWGGEWSDDRGLGSRSHPGEDYIMAFRSRTLSLPSHNAFLLGFRARSVGAPPYAWEQHHTRYNKLFSSAFIANPCVHHRLPRSL